MKIHFLLFGLIAMAYVVRSLHRPIGKVSCCGRMEFGKNFVSSKFSLPASHQWARAFSSSEPPPPPESPSSKQEALYILSNYIALFHCFLFCLYTDLLSK